MALLISSFSSQSSGAWATITTTISIAGLRYRNEWIERVERKWRKDFIRLSDSWQKYERNYRQVYL